MCLEKKESFEFNSFDGFVRGLSYWSSWSTGMAFWKEDFDSIPKDTVYNFLFPHTTILFSQKNRKKYIIDDKILLDEIPQGKIPKGRYNLFNAFGVEYPGIICDLLRNKDITPETFVCVKNANRTFLSTLYLDYIILKRKCSYDLSGYKESLRVFYSDKEIRNAAKLMFIERAIKFPFRFLRKLSSR